MTPLIESSPTLIILAALLAGLLLAILAQTGWRFWTLSRRKEQSRNYLALRTAIILEDFSRQCMEAIQDCELYEATDGEIGQMGLSMPDLAEYPDTASWDLFEGEISNRVLSFRNTVRAASLRVQASQLENRSAIMGIFTEECGICGADAFELARTLRARHGLKVFTPSYDYPAMLAHRAVTARARNDQMDDARIIRLGRHEAEDQDDSATLPVIPIRSAEARKRASG